MRTACRTGDLKRHGILDIGFPYEFETDGVAWRRWRVDRDHENAVLRVEYRGAAGESLTVEAGGARRCECPHESNRHRKGDCGGLPVALYACEDGVERWLCPECTFGKERRVR